MARDHVGVDVSLPLLDVNLIDLASLNAPRLKQSGWQRKDICRLAIKLLVPKDASYRSKNPIRRIASTLEA